MNTCAFLLILTVQIYADGIEGPTGKPPTEPHLPPGASWELSPAGAGESPIGRGKNQGEPRSLVLLITLLLHLPSFASSFPTRQSRQIPFLVPDLCVWIPHP